MNTVVLVAMRRVCKSAVVGYFATSADVPSGWALAAEPQRNIADVMTANRCSKPEALRLMNAHWQH